MSKISTMLKYEVPILHKNMKLKGYTKHLDFNIHMETGGCEDGDGA